MSFRKPHIVLRETAGAYTNGVWTPGTRSVLTIQATTQPALMGQDMDALPEGRKLSESRKIYTDTELLATEQGEGIQPDLVVYDGYAYEVVTALSSQSGVISHYKYIAYRAVQFTSTAGWIAGTMPRS